MLTTLALSLLLADAPTARPRVLLAVAGPAAALTEVKATLGATSTVVDVSPLWRHLNFNDGSGFGTFGGFKAAPPTQDGWPDELTDLWTKSFAVCRDRVAGAERMAATNLAMGCATQLSALLWERLAQHHHADRVVKVEATVDEKEKVALVEARAWVPGQESELIAEEKGLPSDLPVLLRAALSRLDARKCRQVERIIGQDFAPSLTDPWAGGEVPTSPLELTGCPSAPTALTFEAESTLSKALVSSWHPGGAAAPALACALTYSTHDDTLMEMKVTVVTAQLKCGSTLVTSEIAKAPPQLLTRKKVAPVEVLRGNLAKALLARLCGAGH